MIGLMAGLICNAIWLVWRFRGDLPSELMSFIRPIVLSSYLPEAFGAFGLPTLLQAFAAAIAAGWIGRLSVLHGLFAASVAGYVISAGWLALYEPNGLTGGLFTSVIFLSLGVCLALPVALVVARVSGQFRRFASG